MSDETSVDVTTPEVAPVETIKAEGAPEAEVQKEEVSAPVAE